MKMLLLALASMLSLAAFAQNDTVITPKPLKTDPAARDVQMPDGTNQPVEPVDPAPAEAVFNFVEQMPEFPGGQSAMLSYLHANLLYPEAPRDSGIQGTVVVRMVIDHNGSVTNAEVLRGVHPVLDAEALRVVRTMPRWTPGKQNGRTVPVYFNLPIKFTLQ